MLTMFFIYWFIGLFFIWLFIIGYHVTRIIMGWRTKDEEEEEGLVIFWILFPWFW